MRVSDKGKGKKKKPSGGVALFFFLEAKGKNSRHARVCASPS